jgi:hypothetical protein
LYFSAGRSVKVSRTQVRDFIIALAQLNLPAPHIAVYKKVWIIDEQRCSG